MVEGLNNSGRLPVKVVYKGTANSSKEVTEVMRQANNDARCIGVITWMHTFSPAKMWIHGLQQLNKPLLHFHTQYNAEIPWETMDMDFMNLNQSAHGDREFGHICTRMRLRRKVVVGRPQGAGAHSGMAARGGGLGRFPGYAHPALRRPDEQRCRHRRRQGGG